MTMRRRPEVDLSLCTRCEACVAVCPEVFRLNQAGYIEVVELNSFPRDTVEEAIKYCPEDAIGWETEV